MQIQHMLEIDLFGDTGLLPGTAEFSARYAQYKLGPTVTTFTFPDQDTLEEAIRFLQGYNLKFQHIYTFEFNKKEDLKTHPAFLFKFALSL